MSRKDRRVIRYWGLAKERGYRDGLEDKPPARFRVDDGLQIAYMEGYLAGDKDRRAMQPPCSLLQRIMSLVRLLYVIVRHLVLLGIIFVVVPWLIVWLLLG